MVRLAEHDVTTNPDCFQQECVTHQDFEIDRVILHPGYQTNSKHNDIAIIHIKGRIPFNERELTCVIHSQVNDANVGSIFVVQHTFSPFAFHLHASIP